MQSTQPTPVPAEIETPGRRFQKHVSAGVVAYVDPLYVESLRDLGLFEPGGLERAVALDAAPTTGRRARGPSAVLDLTGHSDRLHLRLFHHGGWLGGALGDQLFGLTRPLHELKVNAALEVADAPVPRPIFAIGERSVGPFFRAAFGTLQVEQSQNGAELLRSAVHLPDSKDGEDPKDREGPTLHAAAAAGAALRRFHDAGARHPDLHLGNLLFIPQESQTLSLVIDLDRAEIGPPPTPRRRMAELMRLHRSIVKHGLEKAVGERGFAKFFDAYTGGDRALRRALLAHLRVERGRLALHRLTYP